MIKLTQVKVEDCEAIKELMVEVWNDEHERWFQGKEGPRIPGYDSVKMQEYHRWDNQYNNLDVKENQTSLEMKRCKLAGSKIMDDDLYTGKVIEPGHVYELGYHKCTCSKVLSGEVTNPEHCECTRQSILYILNQLEPESIFEVEILETVLRGSEHCRFRITKK